jgi:hypothetical protein
MARRVAWCQFFVGVNQVHYLIVSARRSESPGVDEADMQPIIARFDGGFYFSVQEPVLGGLRNALSRRASFNLC